MVAPASASSILPVAMPRIPIRSPAVVKLVRSAPTKIAGESHVPYKTRAPMASPDGAQIGEANSLIVAILNDPQPSRK